MRNSAQLGLGGFLLGSGLGWLIFETFKISFDVFPWLVIIAGVGIVVAALFSWKIPRIPVGGLVGGLMVGIVLSLFMTSGFGFEERYRAEETRTFEGSVTANVVSFVVANRNGALSISTWNKSEYKVELVIRAKGFTDIDAERTIDSLDINLDEQKVQNQFRLVLNYDISPETWQRLSIQVVANLPADSRINLDLKSSNGGIYLSNIVGDVMSIQTSNGPLSLDEVYVKSIVGVTSNGRIDGEIEAESASLTTSNGKMELSIPSTTSGDYDLSTSNGDVDLRVSSSSQVGYDLDLSTSNGGINLNLSDLDYSRNETTSKKARTTDFASRTIQITIEAQTSNGNINIVTA